MIASEVSVKMVLAVEPNAAFAAFFKIESDTRDLVILSTKVPTPFKATGTTVRKIPCRISPKPAPD